MKKKKLKKKLKKKNLNIFQIEKKNFLLCKIFAKFLQILNLHTDFRPREEAVTYLFDLPENHGSLEGIRNLTPTPC